MISAQSSAQQYQQAQFATVDRGQLLLMMFDGAQRFLSQAEQRLPADDVTGFLTALGRAQAVIAELLSTLDHQRGGEIAVNLDRLYRFMLDHLIEANVAKSVRHVGQVRRILGIIGDAYREVLRNGMPQLDVA
ncbi:MAG: flagellar biosynthesis protein FliS [Deltaproteobacteria bacterium]|nr:flagellar biosynthesis protein FliS [Deltaproteobacteria bacterium]